MKNENRIRNEFKVLFISIFILAVIFLSILMGVETLRISKSISREYARLYSNEIVGEINVHLQREIALVVKAAGSKTLKAWLKDESNPVLKKDAHEEILQLNALLEDKNTFIVPDKSKAFYFADGNIPLESFSPSGILNRSIAEDIWYFKTVEGEEAYNLNIDVDRFLNTLRTWINVKILDDGEVRGVLGTGLYLDPFINDIFKRQNNPGVKSTIINEYGAIQMDSDLTKIRQNSFEPSQDKNQSIFEFYYDPIFEKTVQAYLVSGQQSLLLDLKSGKYDYVAFSSIKGTNWFVVTFFDGGSLFTIQNFLPFVTGVLFLIISIVIALGYLIQRIFVIPFEKLNQSIPVMGDHAEGEEAAAIYGLDRTDEFGVLANHIHQMKLRLDAYNKDLEETVLNRTEELGNAYRKIEASSKQLDRLINSLPVGVFSLDWNNNFVYGNPYFLEQFECKDEIEFLNFYHKRYQRLFEMESDYHSFMEILRKREERASFECRLKTINNRTFWAEFNLNLVLNESNEKCYEGTLMNIQQKKDYEMQLIGQATVDRLTGAYNRHFFDNFIAKEIDRSSRYGESIAIALFDLDYFKLVNDRWGHDIGDIVLKKTAEVVSHTIRKADILTRWGGEEFVILMPNTGIEGAAVIVEKVRKTLEETHHDLAGRVTASFGVAEREPEEELESWFKRVDLALFKAKNAGRNCSVLCDKAESKSISFIRLIWKSQFESGNELIDKEHKLLFDLANGLMDLILTPNHFELEKLQVESLVNHLIIHFENEEAFLEAMNFDDFANHKAIHQDLMNRTLEIKDRFFAGEIKETEVLSFLVDEVVLNHLLKDDVKFFSLTNHEQL